MNDDTLQESNAGQPSKTVLTERVKGRTLRKNPLTYAIFFDDETIGVVQRSEAASAHDETFNAYAISALGMPHKSYGLNKAAISLLEAERLRCRNRAKDVAGYLATWDDAERTARYRFELETMLVRCKTLSEQIRLLNDGKDTYGYESDDDNLPF